VYDYDPGNITGVMIYGIMFRTIPLKMTRVKKKNSHCLRMVRMCVTAAHCVILSMASDSTEELISDRKNLEHTRKSIRNVQFK